MSTPGGLVDKQELIDAQLDTAHLGRVVNSKDASGAPINTSTNRTGGVNKTLDALEAEYQGEIDSLEARSDVVIAEAEAEFDASIAAKEAEADAAIDEYRLLNKGPYTPGITLESKFEFITYSGESYFAVNPPYTTTATLPDADTNLSVNNYASESYVKLQSIARSNNVNVSEVAFLIQGVTLSNATILYDEVKDRQYYSEEPVSGVVNSVGFDVSGFREISVDASPVQLSSIKDLDLTLIRNNVSKFSANMKARGQDSKVVISGGSVSFSGFNYPAAWSVSGAGYATDQPFGLSSWSWLMRDFWFASNPSFKSIDRLDVSGSASFSSLSSINDADTSRFGMNGKVLIASFSDSSKSLIIKNPMYHLQYLMVSYASSTYGSSTCTFEVNGVSYSNQSPNDLYRGGGYMIIPVGAGTEEIIIDNVVSASGSGVIHVYGVTGSGSPEFHITGKGGYGTGDILAEYSSLIGAYSPNFLIMMVGGNDASEGVNRELYKQNIRDIIDSAISDEPDAVIVFCGPTPNTNVTSTQSKRFNYAMREVIDEYDQVSFIDMLSKLNALPSSYWMYDYTHFNTIGDTLVFNIIHRSLFGSVFVSKEDFVPVRENWIGTNYGFLSKGIGASLGLNQISTIQATAGTPSINTLAGSDMTAVYSGSGVTSKLTVTWDDKYLLSDVTPFLVSENSARIFVRASLTLSSAEFIAVDQSGTQVDINGCDSYVRLSTTKKI